MRKIKMAPLAITLIAVSAIVIALTGYKVYDYTQHDPAFCSNCHTMDEAYEKWAESVHVGITCHDCHRPNLKSNLHQLYVYMTDPPDKPRHKPELENSICTRCHNVEGEPAEGSVAGMGHWQAVLAEAGHQEHVGKQKIQCIRCHSPSLHHFEPEQELCTECHKHTTLEKTAMDQHCTLCHKFKATGREDLRPVREDCLECHQFMQIDAEIFPDDGESSPMHWDCKACHKPHSKPLLGEEDCRECHEPQLADSAIHSVASHSQCLTCHRPHSWKIDHTASCMSCHSDKEEHSVGMACNTCHQ